MPLSSKFATQHIRYRYSFSVFKDPTNTEVFLTQGVLQEVFQGSERWKMKVNEIELHTFIFKLLLLKTYLRGGGEIFKGELERFNTKNKGATSVKIY